MRLLEWTYYGNPLAVDLLRRTRFPFVLALAVYVGSFALDLPPGPSRALDIAVVIAILVQIALWGNRLIAFAIARYVKTAKDQDPAAATTVTAFGFIARLMLWTITSTWTFSRPSTLRSSVGSRTLASSLRIPHRRSTSADPPRPSRGQQAMLLRHTTLLRCLTDSSRVEHHERRCTTLPKLR